MFFKQRIAVIYVVLMVVAFPVLRAFLPAFTSPRLFSPRSREKLSFQSTGWKKAIFTQRKNLLRSSSELMEFDDDFFAAIEPAVTKVSRATNGPSNAKSRVASPNTDMKPQTPHFVRKTLNNGDTYEGEWSDGKRHGFGKYYYISINRTLEGEFAQGRIINGHGSLLVFKSHFIYEGIWVNGLMEGPGRHISKDGFIYEGMFFRGQKCGFGRQVYPEVGVYEGQWKDNVKHGQGKFTSPSGQVVEGEWRDDNMYNVKGERFWKDGTVFKGEMVEGLWQGPGVLRNSQNVTYCGTYVNGQLNGEGTVLFPDGKLFSAEYLDGLLCKTLVEITNQV